LRLPSMRKLFRTQPTEMALLGVIVLICLVLALTTDRFFTVVNAFDLLNTSAVNIIFAVGLLVVLIAGGIDISFAVAALVVHYATALIVAHVGRRDWSGGLLISGFSGVLPG